MANEKSPLSWQTTMPEYPDVSYEAWGNQFVSGSRLGQALEAFFTGSSDYNTWRNNKLDKYNAAMSAYNTWLSTGEGQRASLESGNYNPSYNSLGAAQASPLNYQSDVAPSNGLSEMAQGLSGIFQFVQALQGMKMVSAQIAGQELKNKQQEIINASLAEKLKWQNLGLFNSAAFQGYRADDQAFKTASNLYSVFGWKKDIAADEMFSPFGIQSYNLKPFSHSPLYQRAWADLAMVRSATLLRNTQKEMLNWNIKEKKFYVNSIQQIQKEFWDNQLALAKGELSFQPIAQKLRKQATQWGIGLNVANTAINAAKTVVGMLNPVAGAASSISGVPSWGNMPGQSHSWAPGWDRDTGEWYEAWQ